MHPLNEGKQQSFYELCGAIHLHTKFSDGGVTYDELIDAAQYVNLDYIVVTDHMSIAGKKAGYEGFHNNLSVIIGYEHHDQENRNHYLAVGTEDVFSDLSDPRDYIEAVKKAGGIGFLAHPAEKRHYFGKLPPYPWTRWDLEDFDGVELWNQMSDWMEQLQSWIRFVRLMFPRRFLGNVPKDLLKRWDSLNRERFVSCIGGVDAHTRRIGTNLLHITVFPIKVELKGIRTHLLFDTPINRNDFGVQQSKIMEALQAGHGFISNYRRGDARGTRMFLHHNNGTTVLPGARTKKGDLPAILNVTLPETADIRLIANGTLVAKKSGDNAEFLIERNGVYRIEVFKKERAWIYSNPFPIGPYPM